MLILIQSSYTYVNATQAEKFFDIFIKGMQSVIKDPSDIEGNWNLNKNWMTHSDGNGKNVNKSYDAIITKKKVA